MAGTWLVCGGGADAAVFVYPQAGSLGGVTNIPSYVLTNQETKAVTLVNSVQFNGTVSHQSSVQFLDDIEGLGASFLGDISSNQGMFAAYFWQAPQILPANGHLNGVNSLWKTNLTGNLAVVLTNLFENVIYTLVVSNPATYSVSFNLPADSWVQFQDGASPTATTNGWTLYQFLRTGTRTNAWVWSKEVPLVPGANITFTTNVNSITIAAANQINPMTIGNVAGFAAISNIAYVEARSNVVYDVTTLAAPHSSGNTNFVVDFNMRALAMTLTNDVRFIHSTNRLTGKLAESDWYLFAGPTNRLLYFNANWVGLGTTNNPQVSAIMLETNRVLRLKFESWGGNETNVVAYAAKQQFP